MSAGSTPNSAEFHSEETLTAIEGFVLAGGRSSRMGVNKALLEWGGETMVARAARAVQAAAGSVTIVGDAKLYGDFGFPVIPDNIPGCGPLGGIEAALAHSSANWNLIVACDMPSIAEAGLQDLIRQALVRQASQFQDADVLLPLSGGRPQPLCALYRRRALPVLQEALRCGRFKIMDAISSLRVMTLPASDETLFHNVNTPEEWRALVAR